MKVNIELRDFRGLIKKQLREELKDGDEISIYFREHQK